MLSKQSSQFWTKKQELHKKRKHINGVRSKSIQPPEVKFVHKNCRKLNHLTSPISDAMDHFHAHKHVKRRNRNDMKCFILQHQEMLSAVGLKRRGKQLIVRKPSPVIKCDVDQGSADWRAWIERGMEWIKSESDSTKHSGDHLICPLRQIKWTN